MPLPTPLPTTAAPTALPMPGNGAIAGKLTMWSDNPTIIVGGSCEYANAAGGGVSAPFGHEPLHLSTSLLAVDSALYRGGAACGSCFRVSYDGSDATDTGRPGSMIVEVVDSGSAKEFDCQVDAFETITGARTGVFPITYEPVDCDTADTGATVTLLDGGNAWYTKVVFGNLRQGVQSARLTVGTESFDMGRGSGASWTASMRGQTGPASFVVTLEDGTEVEFGDCFESWPVTTSSFCSEHAAGTVASDLVPDQTPGAHNASAEGTPGRMTMWSDNPTIIVGGSCEYA